MNQKHYSIYIVIFVCLLSTIAGVFAIWTATQGVEREKKHDLRADEKKLIGLDVDISSLEGYQFLNNDKPVDTSKKLFIIYLLSNCKGCKKELQIIEQLKQKYGLKISMLGIMGEEETAVEEFVKEQKINFPVFRDKYNRFAKTIKLKYFPSNFIVSYGKIEKVRLGSPGSLEEMREFVK